MALAAYGFFEEKDWAWTIAVIANVAGLLTGFFGMVAAGDRGVLPMFMIVSPHLLTYLLLRVEAKIVALSFLSGITDVMCNFYHRHRVLLPV